MKLLRYFVLTVAVLAMSSVVYADPFNHSFNTFTVNDGGGAGLYWPRNTSPSDPAPYIGFNDLLVGNQNLSGGAFNTGGNAYPFVTPSVNTNNCDIDGNNPSGGTGSGNLCYQPITVDDQYKTTGSITGTFNVTVNPFFTAYDGLAVQSLNEYSTASLGVPTSGVPFFLTQDSTALDGVSSKDFVDYQELGINIGATAPGTNSLGSLSNSADDPGNPAGVWYLGFAIVGINGAVVTQNLYNPNGTIDGNPKGQDDNGDFSVQGNVDCSNSTETGCGAYVQFVDSEFVPSSTPEPTTMLLLGSGLLFVARRFKR